MQWTDFSNLTAAQRTKLAQFAVIGESINPDYSVVTKAQARGAKTFIAEFNLLVNPALIGIRKTIEHYNQALIKADDIANPPS